MFVKSKANLLIEELMLRCEIKEENLIIVNRFVDYQRPNIKREAVYILLAVSNKLITKPWRQSATLGLHLFGLLFLK